MARLISPRSGAGENLHRIIGDLGQLQADVREVIRFLDDLIAAAREPDETARRERIRAELERGAGFVKAQYKQINAVMESIYDLHDHADVAPYRGDLAVIENEFERIASSPGIKTFPQNLLDMDLPQLQILAEQFRKLRREIALFTIPKRILPFLREGFGVGAPLDFHDRFDDELDDAGDRMEALRRLAELDVNLVGGMVDVRRGMIYRIGTRGRRFLSYALIVATAVLGGLGTIYVLGPLNLLDLPGFSGEDAYEFEYLRNMYLVTVAGVILHIIKKAGELSLAERGMGGEGGPQVVLDRLFLWIHVREYRFLMSAVTAIGAFVILVTTHQLDGVKALLAGYTVDSLSDLVYQRFNTAVSTHTKGLAKALGAGAT